MLDARPTYVATIKVPGGNAEAIAAALEDAEAPATMAVTLFERGEDLIEISAHYAEEPALEQLLALIGAAIGAGDFGDLRIERLLRTGSHAPRACGCRSEPAASSSMAVTVAARFREAGTPSRSTPGLLSVPPTTPPPAAV
jgi:hypothetical protein